MGQVISIDANSPAAKKQVHQLWKAILFGQGCAVTGEKAPLRLYQVRPIDHSYKGVLIGPWYRIPITKRYVEINGTNPFNIRMHPKRFAIEFGSPKNLFIKLCGSILEQGIELPFSDAVMMAIINEPDDAS